MSKSLDSPTFLEDHKGSTQHIDRSGSDQDSETRQPVYNKHGNIQRLTATERAAALKAAQLVDPGIPAMSLRGVQFFFMMLVICLCGSDSGMDGTVMSAINSMTQYQSYFGLVAASSKTGIVFGIYTIGGVVAFFPASYLPDKIGRRWTMAIGNTCLVIGALLTAEAQNMQMFLAGRFLTGLGCTTAAVAAKAYMSEITSPASRGRFMGLLNSFYYIGQILASGIAVPTGRMIGPMAFRAPLFVQIAPAALNVIFIFFLPESPRWLYTRGHKDQARQILANYHSSTRDINSPLIALEIEEIEENVSLSGADKRWWDFRALFATRAAIYRTLLGWMVSVWGQLSGNGLITYFLTILLNQAGITSPDRQRVLNFVNSITSFAGALIGVAVVDSIGRRKLMLFASVCCACGMAIVAGLLSPAGLQTPERATAGICFIFLFMVFFSVGWTPLQGLYVAEVLAFENRAKGIALQGLVTSAVSCINTFGLPSALAVLTWKTYIIFACFDVLGIFVIWRWAVETKQIPLEQMDEIFDSKNPKQTSFVMAAAAKERARKEKELRRLEREAHGA